MTVLQKQQLLAQLRALQEQRERNVREAQELINKLKQQQ